MPLVAELRFLIVDDFPTMRRIVRNLLAAIGCRNAEEAADGAIALDMLLARRFDFVVADIKMPNMNGVELLRRMRAQPSLEEIPVLMVAPEPRKEVIALAARSGASGYIVKPFTKATLAEKLQQVLQQPHRASLRSDATVAPARRQV